MAGGRKRLPIESPGAAFVGALMLCFLLATAAFGLFYESRPWIGWAFALAPFAFGGFLLCWTLALCLMGGAEEEDCE